MEGIKRCTEVHVEPWLAPLVGTRFCAGDGTGTPCPCGNESDPALGNGCENEHGQGATLDGTGSASIAADGFNTTNALELVFEP